MNEQANIIPFGKHKGKLVEELLLDDPNYLQWLSGQPWFREKFNVLYQVIINRGAEPEETPEHNALQVLFLEDEFCLRFLRCYRPKMIDEIARDLVQARLQNEVMACETELDELRQENTRLEDRLRERQIKAREAAGLCRESIEAELKERIFNNNSYWDLQAKLTACENAPRELKETEAHIQKNQQALGKAEAALARAQAATADDVSVHFDRKFEVSGVDVVLTPMIVSKANNIELDFSSRFYPNYLNIEIKPVVGDDYPAVLRQMKANDSRVLFLERYTGMGATREQFIKTFATAEKRVIFANELESPLRTVGAGEPAVPLP